MADDYSHANDEGLMLAVARGELGAMTELVERYHGRIHAYVYRKLGGHHLSEDIVQECFVRMLSSAVQYEYPRPFRPWLYTIAHNLCRSLYRSASFRREAPLETQYDLAAAEVTEAQALTNVERDEVQIALSALSEEHREVVILRFYADMKVHEVAEILNLPVGTVKSRLFYAVKALRGRMGTEE